MNIINANLRYRDNLTPLNFKDVEYVFIHHTASLTATPQQIHQWHLANGWSGAGYNEYIRKDGSVHIMRGDNQGVHVANYNSIGYGICCEGNYDVEKTMPDAQFKSLVARVKHNIDRFPKKIKVLGHGAVNSTSCPGKFFPMVKLYEEYIKKPEVQVEDKEFTEALKYLEKFNEPTAHKELVYRMKEILQNAFETNQFSREQLRDMFRRG